MSRACHRAIKKLKNRIDREKTEHQQAEEQKRQREDRAPASSHREAQRWPKINHNRSRPSTDIHGRRRRRRRRRGEKKKKETRSVPVEIAEAERTRAEQRERTVEEEEGKLLKLGFSGVRKQATEASSSKHLFDTAGKKEFLFFFFNFSPTDL